MFRFLVGVFIGVSVLVALGCGQTGETFKPAPVDGSVDGDRAALVAFDKATGGYQWRYKRNWLSDRPLNEWDGVTTDESGRVVSLVLIENRLVGSIPPELGKLTNLVTLNLSNDYTTRYDRNRLSGPIPAELGNLSNLVTLNLEGNRDLCMPSSLKDWKFYDTSGVYKCSE